MQHANSPLTQNGRLRLVLLVEEDGFTLQAAADACNVAKSTCWEWVQRWHQADESDRVTLVCLQDRSSRPHRSPNQVPAGEAARICERRQRTGWSPRRLAEEADIARPHSTIHQVLRRGGCSRQPRPEAPVVVRYEWPCPRKLLHMDVKKFGRFHAPGHALTTNRTKRSPGAGWEYVHSIIDDCSRLAYSEIHDDETAATVTAFTRRALDWCLVSGPPRRRGVSFPPAPTFGAGNRLRADHDRQRLRPHPEPVIQANALATRDPPHSHAPLHATHQRQGRALPPDTHAGVGLRTPIRLIRRTPRSLATLDQPLQRAPHPLSVPQPTTPPPRSGRHRTQHVAEALDRLARPRNTSTRWHGTG